MASQTLACRIGAGLSTSESAWEAAREAAREARGGALGGAEVDLAFVFFSPAHLDDAEAAAEAVREELAPRHLLGCVAEGVVAGVRELEEGAAVAVWAGVLPGAEIECFHTSAVQTEEGVAVAGFPELDEPGLVALLVDPFTFPVGPFLTGLNEAHGRVPLVGGIAAGGRRPGAQALILEDEVHAEGAVGAVVSGLSVLTLVSQGCRPLGREAVITRCEGNVVYELAGQPALGRLRGEVTALSSAERALAARGLLAGLVIDENRPEYDYAATSSCAADHRRRRGERRRSRSASTVRVGQTLRLLRPRRGLGGRRSPTGARRPGRVAGPRAARPASLLFTCNGRGTHMFPEPDHDARVARRGARDCRPARGFFCGGEIGPVGGHRPSCTGSRPPWPSSSSPEPQAAESATTCSCPGARQPSPKACRCVREPGAIHAPHTPWIWPRSPLRPRHPRPRITGKTKGGKPGPKGGRVRRAVGDFFGLLISRVAQHGRSRPEREAPLSSRLLDRQPKLRATFSAPSTEKRYADFAEAARNRLNKRLLG